MLFMPIITYVAAVANINFSVAFIFSSFAILYGFFVVLFANYKIPKFAYLILTFGIYSATLPLILDFAESRGLLREILYNKHLAAFFMVVIIYNTRFSKLFIDKSVFVLKLTVVLAFIVSVIQVFDETFWNARYLLRPDEYRLAESIYLHRRSSIFGFIDANALGLAFIPLLSVLVSKMLYDKNKFYLLFLVLGGLVAFLSNGRYVMVGFLIITLQVLIYQRTTIIGTIKYVVIGGISFIAILYTLSYIGYDFVDWYNSRLFAEGSVEESSRFKAFYTFAEFFPQSPIFGSGGMTDEIVEASLEVGSSHIHVGYLSHLVSYGLMGCFFLFGFWYLLIKRLYRNAKQTNYWGSFFAFLTFFWSFATMSQSSIFFYGLIFALVFDKYYSDLHYYNMLGKYRNNILHPALYNYDYRAAKFAN